MSRFQKFENAYNDAIAAIVHHMSSNNDDMRTITNWLINTDHNPYSFLQEGWAGSMSTAEGFASLLHTIHHALVDDGDISFPVVNGEPRIAFVWRYEPDVRKYILTEQEHLLDKESRIRTIRKLKDDESLYDISWLNNVSEFIEHRDRFFIEQLKGWYANDAETHGVSFATESYKKYKQFDPLWENELEIEE